MQAVSPILELQRQRLLLNAEYLTELNDFQRQTETIGIGRKVKRGAQQEVRRQHRPQAERGAAEDLLVPEDADAVNRAGARIRFQ